MGSNPEVAVMWGQKDLGFDLYGGVGRWLKEFMVCGGTHCEHIFLSMTDWQGVGARNSKTHELYKGGVGGGLNRSERWHWIRSQYKVFKVFTFQAQRLDRATLEMSPPLDRSTFVFFFFEFSEKLS